MSLYTADISIARGLAAITTLACLAVVVQAVGTLFNPPTPTGQLPICAVPIELVLGSRPELGCANELPLYECVLGTDLTPATNQKPEIRPEILRRQVLPGDRFLLAGGACQRDVGGMSATARLLSGVGLDINSASIADFEQLEGIGPKTAAAIVNYRQTFGQFTSIEDLDRVKGIGPATLKRIRNQIMITPP